MWLKTRHLNKTLFWSIEVQVSWGWEPKPAGLRNMSALWADLFLFLPSCSKSPSAALAMISAPRAVCLGYLPGLLLSSSVEVAQLSKKLFLVCPSQHWKKKNTEIHFLEKQKKPCCTAKFTLLRTSDFIKGNLPKLKDKMKKQKAKTMS